MLWPLRSSCSFYTAFLLRKGVLSAKGLTFSKQRVYTPFTSDVFLSGGLR